ncbi:MAG TPA: DUF1858 domain-containing protein [Chloroflexota bacterium]|nr:DUF1858 domain-containing protein [Chloroflexota bacterium]
MKRRAPPRVNAGMSVREILTSYPSAEAIFERHGLLGCGGPNGPREPVGFFARVHRVAPEILLAELNEHLADAADAEAPRVTNAQAAIVYPLFLATSLVIAILAGFTTGIAALASVALGWVIPGVNWLLLVQTHGRLQLYGWAGLFLVGVAYHVVPRFVTTPIAFPRLARATYWLVVVGLALSLAQMVTAGGVQVFHGIFTLGLVGLVLAALSYASVLVGTVRASEQKPPLPIVFILAGSFWLIVGTVLETVVGLGSVPGQPIQPAFEEPALEAVLEGFLVVTALGVSLRTLPVFAGLAATRERFVPVAFVAAQAGLVGLVGGALLAGDLGQERVGQVAASVGSLAFVAAVATFVGAIRLFEPATLPVAEMGTGRGWARAVRFAYAWLLIGLALQAVASVRAALVGEPIPWGTLGAARHALALGFVTLMIVGMASRVIPVFAGKPLWKAWLVDLATALIVGSVALRVPLEVLAPYGSALVTDLLLTLSGPLALAGLIAFALNFTVTMVRRDLTAKAPAKGPAAAPRGPLGADDLLADALRASGGLSALLEQGLSFLADPGHRAIAARSLTIAQAARRADRDPARVLDALNRALGLANVTAPAIQVDADLTVAEVLVRWPATLDVFVRHGFTPLADPAQRARLAPTITVQQAATARGVDLARLTADLQSAAADHLTTPETAGGKR